MASPARDTSATSAQPVRTTLAVIARVKSLHCAFFAINVAEVMRPLPIVSLASMPPFVLGLSVIRGAPRPWPTPARCWAMTLAPPR